MVCVMQVFTCFVVVVDLDHCRSEVVYTEILQDDKGKGHGLLLLQLKNKVLH